MKRSKRIELLCRGIIGMLVMLANLALITLAMMLLVITTGFTANFLLWSLGR